MKSEVSVSRQRRSRQVRVVDAGVVVDSLPAMFPALVRSGDDLVVTFSTVPDGWPGGQIGMVRSADGGLTWSEPRIIASAEEPEQAVLGAVGMTALPTGEILLPFNGVRWTPGAGVAGRVVTARLMRSRDGGRSWSGGSAVRVEFHGPCVYGSMVTVGGRLLWPIWGQRRPSERWRSSLLTSTDGGWTWAVGPTIGYDAGARLSGGYARPDAAGLDPGGDPDPALTRDPAFRPHSPIDGYSETTLAPVAPDALLAVLRQQGVGGDDTLQLFAARSVDGGRSWGSPERIGFAGMSPLLHPVDGGLLLAYRRRSNPSVGPGAGVEVRVGSPRGDEWSDPTTLVDPDGAEYEHEYQCGYPAMTTLAPDRVLAVFYGYRRGRRFIAWNILAL
jgi:hypothetical protein